MTHTINSLILLSLSALFFYLGAHLFRAPALPLWCSLLAVVAGLIVVGLAYLATTRRI